MSKMFKFFIVVIVIFILSVVLTPLVHGLFPFLKFEKIFNRLVMIFAVLSAVLFVVAPKVRKGGHFLEEKTWHEYGFDFSVPWKKLFCCGFLLGAATVSLMVLVEVKFGLVPNRGSITPLKIFFWFMRGIMSGVAVGIIEEFFFRGFVYRMFHRKFNVWVSIILASVFYSLVHFLNNGQIFIPAHPTLGDAVMLLLGYLEPFAKRPHDILFEAIGLFLFGIILNLAFVYTRSLFFSIGIHAGVVFLIKFQHAFVGSAPEVYHPFYGNTPYYDGPFEWLVLILLGWMVWWFSRRLAR